jgi:hypothetical protein
MPQALQVSRRDLLGGLFTNTSSPRLAAASRSRFLAPFNTSFDT